MDTTTHLHVGSDDRFHHSVAADVVTISAPQDVAADLVLHFGMSDLDALASLSTAALEAEKNLRALIAAKPVPLDMLIDGSDNTAALAKHLRERRTA